MTRTWTLASLTCLSLAVQGQSTMVLPDTNFRNYLQLNYPSYLDEFGNIYTDTVMDGGLFYMDMIVDWTPCDLTGIEYMATIAGLQVTFTAPGGTAIWSEAPDSLTYAYIHDYPGVSLPSFDEDLLELSIWNTPALTSLQLPDSLDFLELVNVQALSTAPALPRNLYSLAFVDLPATCAMPMFPNGQLSPLSMSILNCGQTMIPGPLQNVQSANIDTMPNLGAVDIPGIVLGEFQLKNTGVTTFNAGSAGPEGSITISYADALTSAFLGPGEGAMGISEAPVLTEVSIGEGNHSLAVTSPMLATIHPLPSSLIFLGVTSDVLTELPDLPSGLQWLDLIMPSMPQLDPLPASLTMLELQWCSTLTTLPALPSGLLSLLVHDSPLLEVPTLPDGLTTLDLASLGTTSLPALPDALTTLWLSDLPVECLPRLPEGLTDLILSLSTITCQPNSPPGVLPWYPLCNILNSSCPESPPFVSGQVFWDLNTNGLREPEEPGLPGVTIRSSPHGYFNATDMSGHYQMRVPMGEQTITLGSSLFALNAVPQEVILDITTSDSLVTGVDFAVQLDTIGQELSVSNWWSDRPRPGFTRHHLVQIANNGTTEHDVEVRLTVDPDVSFVSCNEPPTVDGNDLVWEVDSLIMGEVRSYDCVFFTPVVTPLGTEVILSSAIAPEAGDMDTLNNAHVDVTTVIGSFDPNDKQVYPSELTAEEGLAGRRVEYLIRFQNTGTASALRVLVTDTLSADLDPLTFQFLGSSHACTWFFREGALHFLFDPIELPDSTANEPGSHGSILFSITTRPGLTEGATVPNEANIYFDFNEPVITDPAVVTVELPQIVNAQEDAALTLYPVPTKGMLNLKYNGSWVGAKVTLMDVRGSVVHASTLNGPSTVLDLGPVPSGVYVLRVDGAGGTWSTIVAKE